ncbi:MAG: sel1 repeat family protein [Rhodocyclaceae bacterium]|nr:sel1 repeat family protein [Rhodocyclaceae bacterium]
MSKLNLLLSAGLLLQAMSPLAAEPASEADLRKAARLHRGGETAAAVQIWKKWAQQGDVDAAYNLAVIHHHADGVAYDAAEAMRWYRVAAEHGDKAAQYALGLMYMKGEGVPADEAKAHEWFTRNRREHLHHQHDARFQQWQQQARAWIEARDRRERLAASRQNDARTLAELKRRAGMVPLNVAEAKSALGAN